MPVHEEAFIAVRTYHAYVQNRQVNETGKSSYVVSEETDIIEPPCDGAILDIVDWDNDTMLGRGLVRCFWRIPITEEDDI